MTTQDTRAIREALKMHGACRLEGPDGKSLFLALNNVFQIEERGILIAYEGQGTCFFNLDRPMNRFRLMHYGFSHRIAPALADLLNDLLTPAPGEQDPAISLQLPSE